VEVQKHSYFFLEEMYWQLYPENGEVDWKVSAFFRVGKYSGAVAGVQAGLAFFSEVPRAVPWGESAKLHVNTKKQKRGIAHLPFILA